MLQIEMSEMRGLKLLGLKGRIDALTSAEIEKEFNDLILAGERTIVADFTNVSYISSAGLRIFLLSQKNLKKIGGELILFNISESVREVFKVSGFQQLFRIISNESELPSETHTEVKKEGVQKTQVNDIALEILSVETLPGKLEVIGSQDKLNISYYSEADVVKVHNHNIKFGTGLAALGDDYQEYKGLFGESMVIDGSFYSFPALKKSAVDFILSSEINSALTYKFLHGFGIIGEYSSIIHFTGIEEFVTLSGLVKAVSKYSNSNTFGIVIIAESGGLKGMHLKQIPINENKPESGGIFDQQNFGNWFDFPLDHSNPDNIIAAVGVAVKDKSKLSPSFASIFSSDAEFHIHAGIFEKGSLNKNITEFKDELKRILSELQVYKIQHLLGDSKFKCGIAAIIELEDK